MIFTTSSPSYSVSSNVSPNASSLVTTNLAPQKIDALKTRIMTSLKCNFSTLCSVSNKGKSMQLVNATLNNGENNQPPEPSILVGLLGQGIQLSRTPKVHEVEGERLGMNYTYKLLDTAESEHNSPTLEEIYFSAQTCGFSGLNVTYPYKQDIMSFIDVLDDNSKSVGAVNTIVFRDGKSYGHNTDLWGFAEGFRREMSDVKLSNVLQVGAGGAGSAVANALTQLGVLNLFICDIDYKRAQSLATRLMNIQNKTIVTAIEQSEFEAYAFDGVVNTTPVGMAKLPGMPVSKQILKPDMWVSDIIYFPLETQLLKTAKQIGCRTLSGSEMAVFQAVKAFELFTGIAPDSDEMKKTFNAFDKQ